MVKTTSDQPSSKTCLLTARSTMKRLLLLLIALTCLTISSQSIRACQCLEYGTPVCAAYWRSDAVFVGQLRDITPPDQKSQNALPTATLHFIVEQPFRG